ncbi:PK beta-barrel-protein domain-containing protein-like protein [Macroventuria anomochaeta]|uniref:PK beta-barrel-protein domain-containing protein-like protein n=1 Tax=Macroventuria anomochaeta TaxID=301207 RepID=A0ACB6SJM9_9PLEO|nr:PK beta-barrel-protein domain-containing protein-like protein [Macroventuria anomochaeta]KAF2633699.1 PK beta-barrel-protein domain-containing protein-like protein [Macroventuria anomochaeta]
MATDLEKDVDIWKPCTSDVILKLRAVRMKKKMVGLEVGIDKTICEGPVRLSFMALDADEHDPTFHGGVDKAVHGYSASHYPTWRSEFPAAAEKSVPGGFGENFVFKYVNERTVCIGDICAIGDGGAVLQVSLPCQLCYKLNHRFQLKNLAPNTRTIERVQEYLHRNQQDYAMNEELAEIEALGDESRNNFQKRKTVRRKFTIVEKKRQTPRITSFVLKAAEKVADTEKLDPGTYATIKLPNGFVRSYSIVFEKSRGSRHLHEFTSLGDIVEVDEIPFRDRLDPLRDYIRFHDRSLGTLSWNAHVYICGPDRMNLAVKAAATPARVEEGDVHYEAFQADEMGDPFDAEVINRESKIVQVKGEESLLEALRSAFGDVESSCKVGNCGTCRVAYDVGDEKATAMLSYVSRGVVRIASEI